ncbi:MAG: diguanylate cyclase [Marinagarivorans sp.]|nr:diguanylate cyclase [Marinagarivorans sp.]
MLILFAKQRITRPALLQLALLCLGLLATQTHAQQTVYYPRAESLGDERSSYPVELLKLSLKHSDQQFTLAPSALHMQQGRSLKLLAQGRLVDVVWTVTSSARESSLLPIRIPIDRGLLGWRLLLIKQADQSLFSPIHHAPALAQLRAGQGHDWPDTFVLRENQFKITTSTQYENLFHMLTRGHIQYFPRSVIEIWGELDARPHLPIAVENHLVLHYPAALYFFVNKHNTELARAIETGLQKSIADGSMQALFNHHYQALIQRVDFAHRTIIHLKNPQLPALTPTTVSEYWFNPNTQQPASKQELN